jgi:branched-chain amino acid transport system permease protein
LAVSLGLVAGYAGQIALGQSAFYAIGAYTSALVSVRLGCPFWLALPAATGLAAAAGFVVGLPSLRIRGLYLAIVTLMFSFIVENLALNLEGLTGGPRGITNIPRPAVGKWVLQSDLAYYYLVVLAAAALVALTRWVVGSPVGRVLVAIRDDEGAARMLGFRTHRYKLFAFVLASAQAGIAGSLYAHYMRFISPEAFPPFLSILVLVMLIVGGMRRVEGAVTGALIVTILPEVLRAARGFWNIIFGVALILIISCLPGGLWSLAGRRSAGGGG